MKTTTRGIGLVKSDPRAADMPAPVRLERDRAILKIHVQPGARRTGWAGRHGDALRLRISARAADGEANAACVAFLAEVAGVPRSAVALLQGARSRDKLFRIEGISLPRARTLLEVCGL
jgi:hypothetical protein